MFTRQDQPMSRRHFLSTALGLPLLFAQGPASASVPARPVSAFASDRIVVETRGVRRHRGTDIILIPGIASTGEIWRRTAERLDDRHRVHLISVRGFGDIPAGANAAGRIIDPVASEVRRYIVETRIHRPAIIGHSMGGLIAIRAAAEGGDRIGRIMVVDAAPFFPSLISPQARVADVEPVARMGYQALMLLGDQALRDAGSSLGIQLGGASNTVFDAIGWQGGDRTTLAQSLYEVMTLDLRPRLARVTAPVTVVYGWSANRTSPRAHVDHLFQQSFRGLPTPARFERIEGAEHMVMIDRPVPFMQAVGRFLGNA
jgi:pimeloyl-ACP methyl ester carboxylesterase